AAKRRHVQDQGHRHCCPPPELSEPTAATRGSVSRLLRHTSFPRCGEQQSLFNQAENTARGRHRSTNGRASARFHFRPRHMAPWMRAAAPRGNLCAAGPVSASGILVQSGEREANMGISWMTVLAAVPWTEVIRNAPK